MERYLTSSLNTLVFFAILCFALLCCSNGRIVPARPIRAVNLGGWLVTEGWIKPSLFDAIPNKDFLDGTGLQFRSVTVGRYLAAEKGGGTIIVANRTLASGWETFRLWRINETHFNFRVSNNQFVGLNTAGNGLVAVARRPSTRETFEIHRNPHNSTRVRVKAPNGSFLQVRTEELVTADYEGREGWEEDNPSVFELTFSGRLEGEYQVTNGYGPRVAQQVMNEHWSTYIVEEDFKFIKNNGLNAVRIPVGWWIASDPNPPKPFVAGSLKTLDNAFVWAEKYKLKVILDLHCAPGSQNGWEHSGSKDGSLEWGTGDTIERTVDVISFLTARYAKSPSLFAVELLNEPTSPGVSLEPLTKYYKLGYDAVRKHSTRVYVVLSNRLGRPMEPRELFPLARGFSKVVIDVHFYNLFSDIYNNLSVRQNLDYIHTNRTSQLNELTTPEGPLIFVGEWVAEWQVTNAAKKDYQRYAEAQLQVFRRASFGWSYWCLKNVNNHWSLQWMINNGYITL